MVVTSRQATHDTSSRAIRIARVIPFLILNAPLTTSHEFYTPFDSWLGVYVTGHSLRAGRDTFPRMAYRHAAIALAIAPLWFQNPAGLSPEEQARMDAQNAA